MSKLTICPNCNYEIVIEDSDLDKEKTKCVHCKKDFNNPFGKVDSGTKQTKNLLIIFGAIAIIGFGYNMLKSNNDENTKGTDFRIESIERNNNPKNAIKIIDRTSSYDEINGMPVYTVHCTIKNISSNPIQSIVLKAVYLDESKRVVGTATGIANNVSSGEVKTIDIIGMDIDNPKSFEVQIEDVMF